MAATLWNPYPAPIFDRNGDIASGAKAFFFVAGTSTPLTVYSDSDLAVPRTNPVVAPASGVFPGVFLPYSSYRVVVTDSSGVSIFDIDGIANPAPPDAGGGAGIVVTADMVLATGDVKWRMQSGTIAGFVRMNGRTIGSASSGANERANADTEDLYAYLWNTYSDTVAPVSGGRGGSATGDFAANKPIAVPSMRGYGPIGLDDMGAASAANVIQRSTTVATTNTSTSVAVTSASGLGIGMVIVSENIPSGATITAISGTTLTISAAATATASGTAARFSYYPDAQVAGSIGGAINHAQRAAEVVSHTHTGSVSSTGSASVSGSISGTASFNDLYNPSAGSFNVQAGASSILTGGVTTFSPNTGTVSGTFTGGGSVSTSGLFTTAATGSGLPMPTLNPSRLGTFYIKL